MDIYFLDLDTMEWGIVETSADSLPPPSLYGHTATLVGSSIYVMGGLCGDWSASDQLYRVQLLPGGDVEWQMACAKGAEKPEGRCRHTVSLMPGDSPTMFLFGGANQSGSQLSALHKLTLGATDPLPADYRLHPRNLVVARLCGPPRCGPQAPSVLAHCVLM
eukprot:NODE_4697_length_635_cov_84.506826_g4037_i0.p1 GENE.NODE_4697_length_635_cov_84.506826_g4037_i0~~NODE_4697_length_635_cov_84.506826_g4037_i0.p1  ORF type:complete len:162 (-),score=33.66 NODE_4697_length_635_cov_84.506826_g4037_i0:25-510(-)